MFAKNIGFMTLFLCWYNSYVCMELSTKIIETQIIAKHNVIVEPKEIAGLVISTLKDYFAQSSDPLDGNWQQIPKEDSINTLDSKHFSDIIYSFTSGYLLELLVKFKPEIFTSGNMMATLYYLTKYVQAHNIYDARFYDRYLGKKAKKQLIEKLREAIFKHFVDFYSQYQYYKNKCEKYENH